AVVGNHTHTSYCSRAAGFYLDSGSPLARLDGEALCYRPGIRGCSLYRIGSIDQTIANATVVRDARNRSRRHRDVDVQAKPITVTTAIDSSYTHGTACFGSSYCY